MRQIEYVTLDPTGNITCLVTRKDPDIDEKQITQRLMGECEQVAYLDPPTQEGSRARIRLMGGEFCGNAAMASAGYLAARDGLPVQDGIILPIEMSGMDGTMDCHVQLRNDEYEGTVPMPKILDIHSVQSGDTELTAVCMEGITHLILDAMPFPQNAEAEDLLRCLADSEPAEAVGLLEWDEQNCQMRPLVLVKGSETLVWETGCGSGSACIGAYRAFKARSGRTVTDVRQPGGTIRVYAFCDGDLPTDVTITGKVRIGSEKVLTFD